MSFLQGYENDIFISYAHIDNQPLDTSAPLKGLFTSPQVNIHFPNRHRQKVQHEILVNIFRGRLDYLARGEVAILSCWAKLPISIKC
jgi:hypothetical protein